MYTLSFTIYNWPFTIYHFFQAQSWKRDSNYLDILMRNGRMMRKPSSFAHLLLAHSASRVVSTVGTMPGPGMTKLGTVPSGMKMSLSKFLKALALA